MGGAEGNSQIVAVQSQQRTPRRQSLLQTEAQPAEGVDPHADNRSPYPHRQRKPNRR